MNSKTQNTMADLTNTSCVCIIPFYNEKKTILALLSKLITIKNISKIICVDDGSEDDASEKIKEQFPQVTLLISKKNEGKSSAIKRGLMTLSSPTTYVLLLDADLRNLNKREIAQGITYILNDPTLDMLIFKRTNDPFASKLMRSDILFSGDRILRLHDLKKVYQTNPKGFQIEIAINLYMMENRKKVCWVTSSVETPFKFKKRGIKEGLTMDFQMVVSILTYTNYKNHLESVLKFCADEYDPSYKQSDKERLFFSNAYTKVILRKLSQKNYMSKFLLKKNMIEDIYKKL